MDKLKRIKHYIEFLLLKFLYLVVSNFSYRIRNLFAGFASFIMEKIVHYRNDVIDTNLKIAFPESNDEKRSEIKKNFYKHISLFFLEFIRGPKYHDKFLENNVIIENDSALKKYQGKPFLVVTGHFGEFNLFLIMVTRYIQDRLNIIMKEQRNPYSNKFMVEQRLACMQNPILSKGALKKSVALLKDKKYLGFLNDQNAWSEGMPVTFFGKEAPTMKGLAMFVEKFNYPILQGYCSREKNGKYKFWIEELDYQHSEDREELYKNILQASNDHLENAVKQYPEQYLWSHKRWNLKY
jgi:Kdo2-lipid IVA lauroyltransferase/acyltransferase